MRQDLFSLLHAWLQPYITEFEREAKARKQSVILEDCYVEASPTGFVSYGPLPSPAQAMSPMVQSTTFAAASAEQLMTEMRLYQDVLQEMRNQRITLDEDFLKELPPLPREFTYPRAEYQRFGMYQRPYMEANHRPFHVTDGWRPSFQYHRLDNTLRVRRLPRKLKKRLKSKGFSTRSARSRKYKRRPLKWKIYEIPGDALIVDDPIAQGPSERVK